MINIIKFINKANDEELGIYATNEDRTRVENLINKYYDENEEDYNWEDFMDLLEKNIKGEWQEDFNEVVFF